MAAIVVQLIRNSSEDANRKLELYSKTYRLPGGQELQLRRAVKDTLQEAIKSFNVSPLATIVWRDGVGESEFHLGAKEEIGAVREAFAEHGRVAGQPSQSRSCDVGYIVCQKRIPEKFLSKGVQGHNDGKFGVPSGTLVQDIQGRSLSSFYINGRAPPFSTPKPVRFTVVNRDDGLSNVSLADLTWDQCHEYPNWTGPVKVPAVCQMAHKLAELAGAMPDGGTTIRHMEFASRAYFL